MRARLRDAAIRMARRRRQFGRWLVALLLGTALALAGFAWFGWRYRREHSQDRVIRAAAVRHGVDPALVKAVVWRESWFDPRALGRAGEVGLMQIGPLAAREWAEAERLTGFEHAQLFDPAKNTLCGAWYLARLLRRYEGTDNPAAYALADYNAGRANVLKWVKGEAATNHVAFVAQIGFPSTQRYVRAVLARRDHYADTLR